MCSNELPQELPKMPEAIITHHRFQDLFQKHKTIEINPMARVSQIHNGKYNEKMKSEILINTTGMNVDNESIRHLLLYLIDNYQVKIIGNNRIDLYHYLGTVTMFERADFIKSTQIMIDINGNDCWDAAYLKVPSLSLGSVEDTILHFDDTHVLKSHIDSLLTNKLARKKYIEECYKAVCHNKTSYHFTAQLFDKINENNTSQTLLAYVKELIS